jgi:hypothetical protein
MLLAGIFCYFWCLKGRSGILKQRRYELTYYLDQKDLMIISNEVILFFSPQNPESLILQRYDSKHFKSQFPYFSAELLQIIIVNHFLGFVAFSHWLYINSNLWLDTIPSRRRQGWITVVMADICQGSELWKGFRICSTVTPGQRFQTLNDQIIPPQLPSTSLSVIQNISNHIFLPTVINLSHQILLGHEIKEDERDGSHSMHNIYAEILLAYEVLLGKLEGTMHMENMELDLKIYLRVHIFAKVLLSPVSPPPSFSQLERHSKLLKTKHILLWETTPGKMLIFFLLAWVLVQDNLFLHYIFRK